MRLWRYLSPAKFLALLQTSELRLARIDTLGDPHEGSIPVRVAGRTSNVSLADMRPFRRAMRLRAYASCWSSGDAESMGLWRTYAPGTDGVAIATTVDTLRACLAAAPFPWGIHPVRYLDYTTEVVENPEAFGTWLFSKQTPYAYEHEVRVLAHTLGSSGLQDPDTLLAHPESTPTGLTVPVDLNELVTEVRVCPEASPWWVDTLQALITTRFQRPWEVQRSPLDSAPQF